MRLHELYLCNGEEIPDNLGVFTDRNLAFTYGEKYARFMEGVNYISWNNEDESDPETYYADFPSSRSFLMVLPLVINPTFEGDYPEKVTYEYDTP